MSTEKWKETLKSQSSDLEKLQALDAALNENNVVNDIDKILKKPPLNNSLFNGASNKSYGVGSGNPLRGGGGLSDFNNLIIEDDAEPIGKGFDEPGYDDIYKSDSVEDLYFGEGQQSPKQKLTSSSSQRRKTLTNTPSNTVKGTTHNKLSREETKNELDSPSIDAVSSGKAPETADRFLKTKIKFLNQQVEEANELRKQLIEQNKDVQKQLNTEREENKRLQKRIQQLEAEFRKAGNTAKKPSTTGPNAALDPNLLSQEVTMLRKDLETAERIAKQAEANSKSKDTQLKRATDTITRLKSQYDELQLQLQNGELGEKSKLEMAESKIKTLEKQRNELIEGFRKQMRLIDILKRQKVHIEAARLLAFTEEEFMKTLDWKA